MSGCIRVALDTCPWGSLSGHCLLSCCGGAIVLLAAVLGAGFAISSFNSDTLVVRLARLARCSSVNSDHFLVSTNVDCSRACSSVLIVTEASSSISLSFDFFTFLRDCGLVTSATSGDLRFAGRVGSGMVLTDSSSYSSGSSCSLSPSWSLSFIWEALGSSLSSNGLRCCA